MSKSELLSNDQENLEELYPLFLELSEQRNKLQVKKITPPELRQSRQLYECVHKTVCEAKQTYLKLSNDLEDLASVDANNTLLIGCQSGPYLVEIKQATEDIAKELSNGLKEPEYESECDVLEGYFTLREETDQFLKNLEYIKKFLRKLKTDDSSTIEPPDFFEKAFASSPNPENETN
ncbi:uncharacterized protein LOC132696099 [Cylas formicarius]|uniref:uncharacterized protein LOC132696099 n=1 Tax=Cylas formicarius TaxID=197179 RepID=UPI002958B002|nr:uncharacterized protein LOC132696099 [Cylas formicarius]